MFKPIPVLLPLNLSKTIELPAELLISTDLPFWSQIEFVVVSLRLKAVTLLETESKVFTLARFFQCKLASNRHIFVRGSTLVVSLTMYNVCARGFKFVQPSGNFNSDQRVENCVFAGTDMIILFFARNISNEPGDSLWLHHLKSKNSFFKKR